MNLTSETYEILTEKRTHTIPNNRHTKLPIDNNRLMIVFPTVMINILGFILKNDYPIGAHRSFDFLNTVSYINKHILLWSTHFKTKVFLCG